MDKKLTNQKFWENYWKSKNIIQKIESNYSFNDIFQNYLRDKKYKSAIEIGGFPGYYAIYFHKYFKYKASLLDNVIDLNTIEKLLRKNKLSRNEIRVIKSDFFKFKSKKKYDVVFSLGFIEHFGDTREVIARHWELVEKGGIMIIGIPNFLGINGLYQRLFDPKNLSIHNLNSMRVSVLWKIVRKLKSVKSNIVFVNSGLVWLENLPSRNFFIKFLTRILNFLGEIINVIGIRNKFVSTHIFVIAEKK